LGLRSKKFMTSRGDIRLSVNEEEGIQLMEKNQAQHNLPPAPAPEPQEKKVEQPVKTFHSKAQDFAEKIGESYFLAALMSIFTVWALYQGDIKFAATTKEADLGDNKKKSLFI
jgi:hypothetical protein